MSARPANARVRLIASLLSLTLGVAGCSTNAEAGEEGVLVLATTSILGDIASNVVGDEGRVEVLITIGVDPHDFLPSSQQASLIARADLVVANGLGLEQGLEDILDSAAEDGTPVIEMAPLVHPLPFSAHEEEAGQEHDSEDPHFWMDPIRAGDAALALGADLAGRHPDGSWVDRARGYADEMDATDERIRGLLDRVAEKDRLIVTNHEAFGYFADRYGFGVIGVVIPGGSTLAEPSSAELAQLVETMQREDVRVIFAETSRPTALAESVAAELGEDVQIVELFTESLGPAGSGGQTLAEMLITNAERIEAALR